MLVELFRCLQRWKTILSFGIIRDLVGFGHQTIVSCSPKLKYVENARLLVPIIKKCPLFLSLCVIEPTGGRKLPTGTPRQPPQLSQHGLGHQGLESFPLCSPFFPSPACFQLHFSSFYSFAQICLCGKFTARTACLNYLKAQYSRLCHKAFHSVCFISLFEDLLWNQQPGGRKAFAYWAPYTWNSLILGISKMSLIKHRGPC